MTRLTVTLSSVALCLALIPGAWAQTANQTPKPGISKLYLSKATGAPQSIVYDAASAMEFFRTLSGEWTQVLDKEGSDPQVYNGASKIEVATAKSYEKTGAKDMHASDAAFSTIAAGSTVMQRYYLNSPYEMTLMFHMDGPDKLIQTHYCDALNVPTQAFQKTGKPGEIRFTFANGKNLDPKNDTYFHDSVFQVVDKDTFIQFATVHDGQTGKLNTARTVYKRKPSSVATN